MKKYIKDISILVVDDNAINRQVLVFALKKYGAKIDTAENGLVALNKYKKSPYDLILMDIMMPEMDGMESSVRIRAYEKEKGLKPSQIFAISANIQEDEFEMLLDNGINRVSKKPLNFELLESWLKEVYSFN